MVLSAAAAPARDIGSRLDSILASATTTTPSTAGWKQECRITLIDLMDGVVSAPAAACLIRPQQASKILTSCIQANPSVNGAFCTLICDVLSIFWSETESAALVELVRLLIGSLPLELAQETLEASIQNQAHIPGADRLRKLDIRTRTKHLYTQDKYNLLREESEGFSRLMMELHQFIGSKVSDRVDVLWTRISSLIGFFDLDPNRVLDIILDRCEMHPEQEALLEIVNHFKAETICGMLGFKFRFYERTGVSEPTPPSLYALTARLIDQNVFDVNLIYSHLSPDHESLVHLHKALQTQHTELAMSLATVNLNLDAAETSKESQPYVFTAPLPFQVPNQKYDLLAAVISNGSWSCAQQMLAHLPQSSPASYPPISTALCKRVEVMLARAYAGLSAFNICSTQPSPSPLSNAELLALPEQLYSVVRHIGFHLYRHIRAFSHICRVIARVMAIEKRVQKENGRHRCIEFIEKILCECILPAYSLLPSSCPTANDLWNVLKQLPYSERFRLYTYWKHVVYEQSAELKFIKVQTVKATKYFRKRVASGKLKEIGRQLVRFSHNNPLIVLNLILEQLQSFDNMIPFVVDSFKYLTRLSFDVVVYTLLDLMSDTSKEKLKPDGVNIASWFQNLASFCGAFYKKYPDVELQALLQFVANQLKDGSSLDLIVLRQLVTNMSSVVVLEAMSDEQLLSIGGSRTLKDVAIESQQTKSRIKKTAPFLRSALMEGKLVAQLFILMAQMKNAIIFESDESHLHFVCELYDKCQEVFVHFVDFFCTCTSPEDIGAFAKQLPSLYELCSNYHLSPESAFAIVRSVLHFDHICAMDGSSKLVAPEGMQVDADISKVRDDALLESCRRLIPADAWNFISPRLFTTFWSLKLYDIFVPELQYASACKRFEDRAAKPDARKPSSTAKERLLRTVDQLKLDLAAQKQHYESVIARLEKEKGSWLPDQSMDERMCERLMQFCIVPRMLASAADAVYCAKFIHLMHRIGTPLFSTVAVHIKIFKYAFPLLSSCTTDESSRLGRFFSEVLAYLHRWADSEDLYNKEFKSLPGSAVSFDSPDRIEFDQFNLIVQTWHTQLTNHVCTLLQSKNIMIVSNSLHFLAKITAFFPRMASHGDRICSLLGDIGEKQDPGSNLKVLSIRTKSQLEQGRSNWKAEPVSEPKAKPKARRVITSVPSTEKKETEREKLKETETLKQSVVSSNTAVKKESPQDYGQLQRKTRGPVVGSESVDVREPIQKSEEAASNRTVERRAVRKTQQQQQRHPPPILENEVRFDDNAASKRRKTARDDDLRSRSSTVPPRDRERDREREQSRDREHERDRERGQRGGTVRAVDRVTERDRGDRREQRRSRGRESSRERKEAMAAASTSVAVEDSAATDGSDGKRPKIDRHRNLFSSKFSGESDRESERQRGSSGSSRRHRSSGIRSSGSGAGDSNMEHDHDRKRSRGGSRDHRR